MKKINFLIIITFLLLSNCGYKVNYYLARESNRAFSGLEIFIKHHAKKYRNKKAVVVTNHSGVNYYLSSNIKLFQKKGIHVVMLLAPEHGIYGFENEYSKFLKIKRNTDDLMIYNLHKLSDKKAKRLLTQSDIVIFDIQDMGMRCYTYISNLKFIMDNLEGTGVELIILDRPNPIGFLSTDGAFLEDRFKSRFVSAFPVPFIYNMTIGESSLYYKGEFTKDINLNVIKMAYYNRNMFYHETGLPWVPPSPNLPTYESSIVYTSVVLLEGVNISLGRGTSKPFEYIGAPWINPIEFKKQLDDLKLENFKFRPIFFEPTMRKYSGRKCGGVQIFYIGGKFSPTEVSYKIAKVLMMNYEQAQWKKYGKWYDVDYLAGTDKFRNAIDEGLTFEEYKKIIEPGLKKFNRARRKYIIYQ